MPLYINSAVIKKVPTTVDSFVEHFPNFKESASVLVQDQCHKIQGDRLVYVCQREYAVACPHDEHVEFIGSEDATTCHLLVIRHTGSGVTGLAHCDGTETNLMVNCLVNDVITQSKGGPEGRLEAQIVGGFLDDRKESIKLTVELLECFTICKEDINLITACFTDLNDVIKNGIHFPVIYGIAVEVKTGRIFPATFPEKGPDMDIRGALCFAGYKKVHNIYDSNSHELVIGPYSWEAVYNIDVYANLPDAYIRKYLSTSPEQEPPHFESHVRTSLRLLQQHPDPSVYLFPDGQPKRYNKGPNGDWVLISNKSQKEQDQSKGDQKKTLLEECNIHNHLQQHSEGSDDIKSSRHSYGGSGDHPQVIDQNNKISVNSHNVIQAGSHGDNVK